MSLEPVNEQARLGFVQGLHFFDGEFDRAHIENLADLSAVSNVGLWRGSNGVGIFFAEFAFPAGDDGGGEAVADEVDGGAGHVHEFVHADDQEDAFEGEVEGDEGAGEDDLGGAGDAGHAFAGEHEGDDDGELLGDGEFDAGGLGDEHGGDGEVKGGAVEVEGVAHGHDEGDDAFGDAEADHAFHGVGHGGVGRGGGEGEEGGLFDGLEKFERGDAAPEGDGEEDGEAEDGEGAVKGEDEFAEVRENAEAAVADGDGHGGADAEGGEIHDEAGELEHDFHEAFEETEDGVVGFAFDLGEGDAENDGKENDLKDVVGGGGFEEAAGRDVFEDGLESDFGGGHFFVGLARGRKRDAVAGANEGDRAPADEEGEGGDGFEVEDGFEGEAADGFHVVAVAGDADDEGGHDERDQNGFDHPQEDIGDDL